MGGFGSGRHAWKRKTAHCRSLDVNRLHREGHLDAGHSGGWQWSCDGQKVASIGSHCDGQALVLAYRVSPDGADEKEDIEERVLIERMPCRYGGARPWFRCPGIVHGRHCGRRVGKLYLSGRYFLCRHCHRLSYASQSETALDRTYRRRDKLRADMGAEPGCMGIIPPRPKGMWHRTYRKRLDAVCEADMQADEAFGVAAAKLLRRLGRY